MKKLAVLLAVALLLAAVTVLPASAESLIIKNGSPKVDGVKDPLYLDSGNFGCDSIPENFTIEDAQVYMLWDSNYLYIGIDVKDPELDPAAAGVILFFSIGYGMGDHTLCTMSVDCYGEIFSTSHNPVSGFSDSMSYAASKINENEDGYFLEVAIALNDIKAGTDFGFHACVHQDLENDGDQDFALCGNGYTFLDGDNFCCVRKAAKAPETEPVVTTAPAADTTGAPAGDNTQEVESGCGSVVASATVVTAALGAALVCVLRKKEEK